MGILDHNSLIIIAVLTQRGRELLSQGKFNPTKYAFADDNIDYSLWDKTAISGNEGAEIEKQLILEPVSFDKACMRYKLITLDRDAQTVGEIITDKSNINIIEEDQIITVNINSIGINNSSYNIITSDYDKFVIADSVENLDNIEPLTNTYKNIKITESRFFVKPRTSSGWTTGYIIVEGNDSGARTEIKVILNITLASS